MTANQAHQQITIRRLHQRDMQALATLAELDSAPIPAAPVLGAEVDGRLLAAVSIEDGEAVADPFRRSLEAVELLRSRAAQLHAPRRRRRRRTRGTQAKAALAGSPPGAGGRLLDLS